MVRIGEDELRPRAERPAGPLHVARHQSTPRYANGFGLAAACRPLARFKLGARRKQRRSQQALAAAEVENTGAWSGDQTPLQEAEKYRVGTELAAGKVPGETAGGPVGRAAVSSSAR